MNRIIVNGILTMALAGLTTLAAQQAPKQLQPKSKGEYEAVMAMANAPDPDTRIKAAETLITKYADTDFKALALFYTAASYEQKGDFEKVVVYGERTLEADPQNYQAMLMLARNIAQRTREFDLDREEKLGRVEKYVKSAEEVLKAAAKPNPQLSDEQWTGLKKDLVAQGHEALGMSALARKKYDVAATEFKMAVEGAATPEPATMLRLANAYTQSGKYDDALPLLDKIMAFPACPAQPTCAHPQVKQFAQAEKVRATQLKSGGAKPAAAPATTVTPGTVEVKKP